MPLDLSRIGYHYFPDEAHYTQRDLSEWVPVFKNLKAQWLILRGSLKRSVPEAFIRTLLDNDITPILHIPVKIGTTNEVEVFPLLQTYAKWGIQYVVIGDRPNMKLAWEQQDWSKTGIVERFVDLHLPILQTQQSVGLFPCLPPLEPGGDYWDTSFLMGLLQSLRRRGEESLLASLKLGIYAWTYNRPLTWGSGGPESWPDCKPYQTPIGSEDQIGFKVFEWYQAIAEQTFGGTIPMVVLAGGPGPVPIGLEKGSVSAQTVILDILRSLSGNEIPDYLENFAFYPVFLEKNQEGYSFAWYRDSRQANPLGEAVSGFLAKFVNQSSAHPPQPKRYPSYFLVSRDGKPDEIEITAAFEQAARNNSVIGFELDEACKAEHVFLVGFKQSALIAAMKKLQDAGCSVHASSAGDIPAERADFSSFSQGTFTSAAMRPGS